MAIISYGSTSRPVSNNATRRRERRKIAAIQRDAITSIIDKEFGIEPEKRAKSPRKAEILCKRPVKPLLQYPAPANEYTQQIERNAEKLERKNRRIWYRDANPLGNKIHAVQKMRGKSMPVYFD